MSSALFIFLSVFTIVCALGMVAARNAVNGAMCLLLCLGGVAGLFIALDAYLLAFLLILVYAGAIVALFLFIIMLLDVRGQDTSVRKRIGVFAGLISGALLTLGVISLAVHTRASLPAAPVPAPVGAPLKGYAEILFTTYLLPVQVMGFLLLIAMLGVIVLSQRPPPAKEAMSVPPSP
ncbi:MAG TPA: NADH-quinone oxidoreductase subunit J [Opitutaceae bacterium]